MSQRKNAVHSQKVIVVQQMSQKQQGKEQTIDPLEQQINSLKLTLNLTKQMSFNNSINKFDNFQLFLRKQNEIFNTKMYIISNNQNILLKKIKNIKQTLDIKPKKFDDAKLYKDLNEIVRLRAESQKYNKLSNGMIQALNQIDKHLDNKILSYQPASNKPSINQTQQNIIKEKQVIQKQAKSSKLDNTQLQQLKKQQSDA